MHTPSVTQRKTETTLCLVNIICYFKTGEREGREKKGRGAEPLEPPPHTHTHTHTPPGAALIMMKNNIPAYVIFFILLGRSEVLRSFQDYLWAQSQGHHTVDHLEEREIARRSSLKGWERAIVNKMNIGTVDSIGKTSERQGAAHMGFSKCIDTILNWTELNIIFFLLCGCHLELNWTLFSFFSVDTILNWTELNIVFFLSYGWHLELNWTECHFLCCLWCRCGTPLILAHYVSAPIWRKSSAGGTPSSPSSTGPTHCFLSPASTTATWPLLGRLLSLIWKVKTHLFHVSGQIWKVKTHLFHVSGQKS